MSAAAKEIVRARPKVEPWTDDFTDGSITDDGWPVDYGTWSVNNGGAQNSSSSGNSVIEASTSDNNMELRFQYSFDTVPSGSPELDVEIRKDSSGSLLDVVFLTNKAQVWKYTGGTWTKLDENTGVSTSTGTKYDVRIVADGSNLKVYRSTGGGLETQVFNTSSVPTYSGTKFLFYVSPNLVTTIGKVMVLADDLSRTTTFTPASNNELSSASDYNGSTTYAYDSLGRMSTETKNSVTKTYTWAGPSLLAGVSSSASGATSVSYTYTGDNKRLFRLENGNIKNSYTYGAGFDVNAETAWSGGSPTSTKTYAGGGLAEVDVTGTPAYVYMTHDHLGSTTGAWDGSIDSVAAFEYAPYGTSYLFAGGINITSLYTGYSLDRATGTYSAPFRTLGADCARWLKKDALGMVDNSNMYAFVGGNPINASDPLGLTVRIYIWNSKGGSWGHSAGLLGDGTYISFGPATWGINHWWQGIVPQPGGQYGTDANDTTNNYEHRPPDVICDISGLDEDKMKDFWNQHKHDWYWGPIWQCTNLLGNALAGGGIPFPQRYFSTGTPGPGIYGPDVPFGPDQLGQFLLHYD